MIQQMENFYGSIMLYPYIRMKNQGIHRKSEGKEECTE